MMYVYDILANLNEEMYDFYDWDSNDDFSHVRRVPMFKVSNSVLFDLASKKVKVTEEFKMSIKDKTQIFSSRNIEVLPYASIFTDGVNAFMLEFNDKGYTKRKSKFLVNEELEILDIAKNMKVSDVSYNVVNNKSKRNSMIRSERKLIDNIIRELDIFKDDKEKIDYLYYEWFECQDGENKYETLVKSLRNGFTEKHLEFMELINLLTIKR